jgi:ABC-2 type transport system ATP-binding protein
MTAAIEITNLTKRYGALTAVEGLNLEVPKGSVFGFLGANGAGKTTTIRMIAGLAQPTSGTINVSGVRAGSGTAYRRGLGYLCQEPSFYRWMTGREVLRYAAGFYPELDEPVARRVHELLELVGLRDAADRRCGDYSGGMRQRLGIGAALVSRPPVVVLDEPASGLDPVGRRDVLRLLEALRGQTTVFYSTHILDDVERVSDRLAVLDHGRLVTTSRTDELIASFSRNRLRVELAGATGEDTGRLAALPGVASAEIDSASAAPSFVLQVEPDAVSSVQSAITQFASANGLAVVQARPIVLDLEEVFLRLIGETEQKELAA